jgi:DNA topoisomerase-1
MHLVIVESPTKAKTIRKFLGPDYTVVASMGHVRDLPQSASDVPAEFKKTPAGNLGVDVAHDFEPIYVVPKEKTKTITELKKLLKGADDLYLATDEDREGESISWHLLEILKPKVPVRRMVFHEITKPAIASALEHPRELDEKLVRAQETRRILDRLVGYTISPILWKKITYGLSAGRVQSSALKAIVDRERARIAFVRAGYWDVTATLEKGKPFEAKLHSIDGKRIASGKDFDEETGTIKATSDVLLVDEARAKTIAEAVKTNPWSVTDLQEKPLTRKPAPPFITSTLQQEANRKLGLSSKETMRTAQGLYEKGHITYMRTDSVNLSQEAVNAARALIKHRFGEDLLPDAPRHYDTKAKGAQEAHEAIRPSLTFSPPDELGLSGAERDVYELIWMRTLASQMPDSQQLQKTAFVEAAGYTFQATGLTVTFPGFLRAYAESSDDPESALSDKDRPLPPLAVGDHLVCQSSQAEGHETKPPARFTEAGLVQYMEKEGIGRPSTYASIISTLQDRGYVKKVSNALVPTFTAFAVTGFMEKNFGELVDAGFTSTMENSLDDIAEGKQEWLPYLRQFYFGDQGLETRVQKTAAAEDTESPRVVRLPQLSDVPVHIGRFGPYFEATHPRSGLPTKASVPDDLAPADFTKERIDELLSKAQQGPTSLGQDPATGLPIFLKTGAYGPYLQLGEDPLDDEKAPKPKRVSVPKNIPINTLDAQKAIALVSLPRKLGVHPADGKDILVGLGRFGPYVKHDADFRSLKAGDDIFTVELPRALELLAMPKGSRGGGKELKKLGDHPKDKKPVTLYEGKFGTYVKHGKTNATLPKGSDPNTFTLEQALELLATKKKTRSRKST